MVSRGQAPFRAGAHRLFSKRVSKNFVIPVLAREHSDDETDKEEFAALLPDC